MSTLFPYHGPDALEHLQDPANLGCVLAALRLREKTRAHAHQGSGIGLEKPYFFGMLPDQCTEF